MDMDWETRELVEKEEKCDWERSRRLENKLLASSFGKRPESLSENGLERGLCFNIWEENFIGDTFSVMTPEAPGQQFSWDLSSEGQQLLGEESAVCSTGAGAGQLLLLGGGI